MTVGKLLKGADVRDNILMEIKEEVEKINKEHWVVPGLATILVGDDPSSKTYVEKKIETARNLGFLEEHEDLPQSVSEKALLTLIQRYNKDERIHGILVQLPLPSHISKKKIIEAIDPDKDVDGFHPVNVGRLCSKSPGPGFIPCTPAGIMEMLNSYKIRVAGRRVAVLGRSNIAGQPTALLLQHANGTVTVCHTGTLAPDVLEIASNSDILVVAMGKPALVTEECIKPGAVVIDIGITRVDEERRIREIFNQNPQLDDRLRVFNEKGYTLVGDVHPNAAPKKASAYTPVPGGVGPMTIAMLMKNALKSLKLKLGID